MVPTDSNWKKTFVRKSKVCVLGELAPSSVLAPIKNKNVFSKTFVQTS